MKAQHFKGQVIPGLSIGRARIAGIIDSVGAVSSTVAIAIDCELPDQEGSTWRLADHLVKGAVLLIVYRGDW